MKMFPLFAALFAATSGNATEFKHAVATGEVSGTWQKNGEKYHGKVAGDTITGISGAPGPDGGAAAKLDWNAKRMPGERPADAIPQT